MTYRIELSSPVRRAISGSKLPRTVIDAALYFIQTAIAENPRRVGGLLKRELEGTYSAHHPEGYRIFYTIDDETNTVVIEAIDRRADAYRRR